MQISTDGMGGSIAQICVRFSRAVEVINSPQSNHERRKFKINNTLIGLCGREPAILTLGARNATDAGVRLALADVNNDRVEAAYRRSDLFEHRRDLMLDRSDYLTASA